MAEHADFVASAGGMELASECSECAKPLGDSWVTCYDGKKRHGPCVPEGQDPFAKVWDVPCLVCGAVPTVDATELCGPCTFGEADTAGGSW